MLEIFNLKEKQENFVKKVRFFLKIEDYEITDFLFAFSLFASFSTYFRFQDTPVGLFEFSNTLFIFSGIKKKLFQYNTSYGREIVYWWIIFLLFSMLTTVLLYSSVNRPYLYHDLFSYIYAAILSFFYASYRRSLHKIIIYTLYILFFSVLFSFTIGDFYSSNNRFMNFSKNPNQLGVCFSILSYLIMNYLDKKNFNKYEFFIILSICIISFYSKSNSQLLTYFFVILFVLYQFLNKSFYTKFLGIILFLMILPSYYDSLGLHNMLKNILSGSIYNELFVRFEIWRIYFYQIINFPFGIGLGNVLLIPKNIIQQYLNTKLDSMFFDPHNSFINYLYIAGVIPTYFLLRKIIFILYDFYNKNEISLFFGFLSIIIVMSFHNFTRHPILYFYIIYFIRKHYNLSLSKDNDRIIQNEPSVKKLWNSL